MTGSKPPLPREWRIYAVSNFASQIGTCMQSTALAWLVLDLTGSSSKLGLLVAMQFLPSILLAVPAGKAADLWSRRNLLLGAQAAMAVLAAALAAVIDHKEASYPILTGFALLLGVGNGLSQATRLSLAATLAGAHGRTRAAGLATLSFNLARMLGPALAGFTIALWGPAFTVAANAASFIPLVVFLASRNADDPPSRSRPAATSTALRFLWSSASTRVPLLTVAVVGAFAVNMQTLVPAYARLGLGLDASGFGLLMSAVGAGACIGGLLQWRRPAASNWRPLAAAAGLGLCLLVLSALHQLPPAALVLAGFGVCSATVFSSASAAVQTTVPDPLRNAATSLQVTIVQGTNPIGSALTGWVLEQFGASGGAAALGAATLAAIMGLALAHRGELMNARSVQGVERQSSAAVQ
jgi:predicted MFS family arabinose efflux permease